MKTYNNAARTAVTIFGIFLLVALVQPVNADPVNEPPCTHTFSTSIVPAPSDYTQYQQDFNRWGYNGRILWNALNLNWLFSGTCPGLEFFGYEQCVYQIISGDYRPCIQPGR